MILGADLGVLGTVVAPAIALVTLVATGALLVWDLKRPERFLYLFLKPNPTSWLFWGAVALAVYAVVAGLWFLAGLAGELGLFDAGTAVDVLAWPAIPAAVLAAGYTGFLFGQAEGRDLWQSPLLFWHLQVQALMVGAGALAVALLLTDTSADGERLVVRTLVLATAAHVVLLVVEYGGRHTTRHAAAAARMVTHGRYAPLFWSVAVGLAVLAAGAAALSWNGGLLVAAAGAGLLVQVVLLAYESVFVRAGQDVPLS
jgi:formate-dependent nitrite reductase membrane component NrfD